MLTARAYLPLDRFVTLSSLVYVIQGNLQTTIRNFLHSWDNRASCAFLTNHTKLRLYHFQGWLRMTYSPARHTLNRQVMVLLQVRNSLDWWKNQLSIGAGIPFCCPAPSITLTDASVLGMGSSPQCFHNSGHMNNSGNQSPHQCTGTQGCLHFLPLLRGKSIRVMTNNISSMFCISKQGGARFPSLCTETMKL